jgi:hypothetical protein
MKSVDALIERSLLVVGVLFAAGLALALGVGAALCFKAVL